VAEDEEPRNVSTKRPVRTLHPNRDNGEDSSTKRTYLMDEIAEEKRAGKAEIERMKMALVRDIFEVCEVEIKKAARNQKKQVLVYPIIRNPQPVIPSLNRGNAIVAVVGSRSRVLATVNSKNITYGQVLDEVVKMLVGNGLEASLSIKVRDDGGGPFRKGEINGIKIKF
jgi:hypothetical protein